MKLDSESGPHSKYNLRYHLIFVTKYRKDVIDEDIGTSLVFQINRISESSKHFDVIEVNHDKNHVHILFTAKPSATVSKIVNKIKGATSRKLRNDYPKLEELPSLWSPSYYVATSGNVTLDRLIEYIENQGEEDE